MKPVSRNRKAGLARFAIARPAYVACLVSALGFASAFGMSTRLPETGDGADRAAISAAPAVDPYRLIVDALLAPALDADAVPLRWADPRDTVRCGAHTAVQVNHQPLVAGATLPETPFEIEWHADGCHVPGAQSARLDGWVNLTVFREDWGLSAIVEPAGLRVESGGFERAVVQRGSAWLTRCGDSNDGLWMMPPADAGPLPC